MKSEEEVREALEVISGYVALMEEVPILALAVGEKGRRAMVGAAACLGWMLGEPAMDPCPVQTTIEAARRDIERAAMLRENSNLLMEGIELMKTTTEPVKTSSKTIN